MLSGGTPAKFFQKVVLCKDKNRKTPHRKYRIVFAVGGIVGRVWLCGVVWIGKRNVEFERKQTKKVVVRVSREKFDFC